MVNLHGSRPNKKVLSMGHFFVLKFGYLMNPYQQALNRCNELNATLGLTHLQYNVPKKKSWFFLLHPHND